MPKVSIIIPVYNTEAYLRECLDSVCQQSEQNIEIIIVDDASPDNSWAIIEEYAARDSRIQAIRHAENKHSGGARNTGIEAARAEWLLFLDSDDYIRLDTVEILLNASKEELDLIIYGIWQVPAAGQLQPFGEDISNPMLLSDIFREYCMAPSIYHSACDKLWRRSLFKSIRFPEHMNAEDFATMPRVFAQVRRALVLPERLYFYQYRENSADNYYTAQSAKSFGRAFDMLQDFVRELAPERRPLLENRIEQEFKDILQLKQVQNSEFQMAFAEHIPKDLLAKGLWDISSHFQQSQAELYKTQQDRWYRFGRMSRKRKLWVIAKNLSKGLGIYKLLSPVVKTVKRILQKS